MISYYEGVLDVIKDSLESIPVKEYNKLIDESVEVLKNGGKI